MATRKQIGDRGLDSIPPDDKVRKSYSDKVNRRIDAHVKRMKEAAAKRKKRSS
jgi:hypothetical protein